MPFRSGIKNSGEQIVVSSNGKPGHIDNDKLRIWQAMEVNQILL